ncbi:deoxyuridine 5-triphosphate nucleotidohydrolase [Plasmopara halstedii]|uniref:Deoxyuridine 5'-triphosphate nucleotidohydrolase n=1 Tax=Plasmopara halstedii TaxID=4781 RepID=A0A0P1AJ62_PLAHL|nr:deoxyuridine 5-triphosphate nucleotidohydrolase [Plasmopara halstedii]CEG41125.1 deoxyuridine 5-triphosphate nucleotidohydrolase [Plasmopara halstedii]|eukprot:XP_024577494.1 deoxyuridine 5-triphosphate nucleotidohydrolase [Plasmopara halstedii]
MAFKHSRGIPILRVKRTTSEAILPTRGSSLAAGLDLSAAYDAIIPSHGKGIIKTDLVIAVPEGCYARVAPRSGLALKNFIDTGAGVIDADYRGNVGVILFNHSNEDFIVKRGDRVAQLILEKIEYPEVQEVTEIEDTERGAGGFGSTGVAIPLTKKLCVTSNGSSDKEDFNVDTVFKAIELLSKKKVVDNEVCNQLKEKMFTASTRQFCLLNKALNDYLEDEDSVKVLEWINAFLNSH